MHLCYELCAANKARTCSEVDDNITEEDGVWDNVENDPAGGEVVIEEGDGNGEDDEVGDEEEEHADVPVEPEFWARVNHPRARHLEKESQDQCR